MSEGLKEGRGSMSVKSAGKIRAGIVGATGMVGQRFATLLERHPYFEATLLAASAKSAGKTYAEAAAGRWKLSREMPIELMARVVVDAADVDRVRRDCDFVFCAVDMKKEDARALEEAYAKAGLPVVSNNSACRGLDDVPMLIPEINADHIDVIAAQRRRLGTDTGFVAAKPNCSIQSYVPMLAPLRKYGLREAIVATYQAISGAGKTFGDWPEITDNAIPYIGGEEEKSEREPLKIFGSLAGGAIADAEAPLISAQCIRIPVADGHMAAVSVKFENKPSKEQILADWANFGAGEIAGLGLPSAPKQLIRYFEEPDRPQIRLDRGLEGGMGVAAGRLREDSVLDYKFVGLSHNTLRGAAGGAVLMAELLYRKGYIGAGI
jgi:aspartate-semialdehyde dehydrogenase